METRLAYWINALRTIGKLAPWWSDKIVRDACVTRTLWVVWPEIEELPTHDPAIAEIAFQALEIITLLTHVGRYDACVELLLAVWPYETTKWLDRLPSCSTDGFRVGCKISFETRGSLFSWAMMYVTTAKSELGSVRSELLRQLVGEVFLVPNATSIPVCLVPIHVGICVNGEPEIPFEGTQSLLETTAIAEIQTMVRQVDSNGQALFMPRSTITEVWLTDSVTEPDFICLDRLASSGVAIALLPVYTTVLSATAAVQYIPTIQRLFASTVHVPRRVGSSTVSIHSIIDQQTASSIFSALLDSRSVRELNIFAANTMVTTTTTRIWQWLALSVFSRHATNALDSLMIRVDGISIEDVAAMEALIQAPNPLGTFFNNPNQSDATVAASRFWFSRRTGEPELSFNAEALVVRVLDDRQEDWISVLLPGYGQAWVQRSDIQLCPSRTVQCVVVHEINLRGVSTSTQSPVVKFLQVVGHNLPCLFLSGDADGDVTMTDQWYFEILRACPNVQLIEINQLDIGPLHVLSEAFELGITKLQELSLKLYNPQSARLVDLFSDLTDKNKAIARRLASLTIEVTNPNDSIPEVQNAIERMLCSNYYLDNVDITLTYSDPDVIISPPTSKLDKFHGEPIYGRQGPLPLVNKLAFLSIVDKTSVQELDEDSLQRLVRRFDQLILTRVFEFAAQSKLRQLRVTSSHI